MSPMAKISGWPGRVQSGETIRRPARSVSIPAASASRSASGEAFTPAAQMTVFAVMRRWLPVSSATSMP